MSWGGANIYMGKNKTGLLSHILKKNLGRLQAGTEKAKVKNC